jgi:hypothetical protein
MQLAILPFLSATVFATMKIQYYNDGGCTDYAIEFNPPNGPALTAPTSPAALARTSATASFIRKIIVGVGSGLQRMARTIVLPTGMEEASGR